MNGAHEARALWRARGSVTLGHPWDVRREAVARSVDGNKVVLYLPFRPRARAYLKATLALCCAASAINGGGWRLFASNIGPATLRRDRHPS